MDLANMLGVKIAGGIILLRPVDDERQYNRSMDAWIRQVLERLDGVRRECIATFGGAADRPG